MIITYRANKTTPIEIRANELAQFGYTGRQGVFRFMAKRGSINIGVDLAIAEINRAASFIPEEVQDMIFKALLKEDRGLDIYNPEAEKVIEEESQDIDKPRSPGRPRKNK